jgi:hypothetical protein
VLVTFACLPPPVTRLTLFGTAGPTGLAFGSGLVVTHITSGADTGMQARRSFALSASAGSVVA